MRFIFDANLSPKLVNRLSDLFPGSVHLFDLPYPRDVDDNVIWSHARDNGFGIVTPMEMISRVLRRCSGFLREFFYWKAGAIRQGLLRA